MKKRQENLEITIKQDLDNSTEGIRTFDEDRGASVNEMARIVRLLPANNTGTHLKVETPLDHIFVFPGKYHIKYNCRILDNKFSASDHNPVMAYITIIDPDTEEYRKEGKGVFQER